jgi:hypothetical protein
MTVISFLNFVEKCHDIKFLRDIMFSCPLYDGDVKFCRCILKSSVDKAFWEETMSFLQ